MLRYHRHLLPFQKQSKFIINVETIDYTTPTQNSAEMHEVSIYNKYTHKKYLRDEEIVKRCTIYKISIHRSHTTRSTNVDNKNE